MSAQVTSPTPPAPHGSHRGGPTDPSHDEELRRGIIHTQISRGLAWALALGFLGLIFGLPVSQAVLEKLRDEESMLLDVFKNVPTKESLKRYEEDLEKACYIKDYVQPRMQQVLTQYGGAGNKKAVIGRDGWLYYQPGVMAVAGPGFLDAEVNRARVKALVDETGEVLNPDPRPAILAFHAALKARGIALVIFPVPDKSSLQPRELHGRVKQTGVPAATNRDMRRFVDEMRAAGVIVFEGAKGADVVSDAEPARFLVQDTHWTPRWMKETASQLAALLGQRGLVSGSGSKPYKRVTQDVSRVGDIVDMLKLPEGQTVFAPHTVAIEQVQDADGKPWEPQENAEVLLLGDSFSNIFTLGQMGWGQNAGFAPHLSAELQRPLDVIAQNDSGAFATRQTLSRALAAGEDRLKGKRVVIWEFASRELAVGDWKALPWTLGAVTAQGGP